MYRALKLTKKDGSSVELEITKAVAVDIPKKMFNVDGLPDGKYRMIWTKSLCENFSDIEKIEIVRRDDNEDN